MSTDPDTSDLIDGVEDEDLAALLVACDDLVDVPPPPSLRARLLASASPFHSLADRVADLFQVGADTIREYLALLTWGDHWHLLQRGCELIHVEGGPDLRAADVGFVRVQDGVVFPHHAHGGQERSLVLQGEVVDSDGEIYLPGDMVVKEAGSEHHFRAVGETIIAVVVWGVRFDDDLQGRLRS
ncbi:MAG TPA: cupin domain-containing protein [Myxococcota bacterium]|nr:cupin domain-containing protein [Myxococcota bacterium]